MYYLITAPTSEPIALTDAKDHLRIAHDSQDDLITLLISAARKQFENDVPSIQLMPATWGLTLDQWPSYNSNRGAHIFLQKYPLTAISSIKYYPSGSTTLTTLAPSNYEIDLTSYPGRIKFIEDLPDLNEDKLNRILVTFTCGYADAASVPADIIAALKLMIGHLFENPQQVMTGTQVNQLPFGYQEIVANYTKDWL